MVIYSSHRALSLSTCCVWMRYCSLESMPALSSGHHSRCVRHCFQRVSRPTCRTSSLRSCTVEGPWLIKPFSSGPLRIARLRLSLLSTGQRNPWRLPCLFMADPGVTPGHQTDNGLVLPPASTIAVRPL